MQRGNPWICKTDRNSNVYISNPRDASINVNTISGTFARSHIEFMSLGHSNKVILYFFDVLIVIGPAGYLTDVFV